MANYISQLGRTLHNKVGKYAKQFAEYAKGCAIRLWKVLFTALKVLGFVAVVIPLVIVLEIVHHATIMVLMILEPCVRGILWPFIYIFTGKKIGLGPDFTLRVDDFFRFYY